MQVPYIDLSTAIEKTTRAIQDQSVEVHTDRWQGWDIKGRPDYVTFELLNYSFKSLLPSEKLEYYRGQIKPNLPWADDHFEERVGGEPINPGIQWANWPWGKSANAHRKGKIGPTIPPQDLAYAAGMIDGEGTIYWREGERWQGVVRVYQKDRMICDHLHRLFKVGKVDSNNEETKTNIHGKEVDNHCFFWQINSQLELQWLLKELIPYLVIKKQKAIDALEIIERSLANPSKVGTPLKKLWGKDWEPKFNHNYMTRLWPKGDNGSKYHGLNHTYGDLQDVVDYLVKEPTTRQAWIPLFFPEDTGFGDGGRKPCTLGYQFIVRGKKLHVYYPLRSCDFVRHFRDDIYLAVRLLLWVLDECRKQDPQTWNEVTPGTYTMHCTSLHIFTNDWIQLFGKPRAL